MNRNTRIAVAIGLALVLVVSIILLFGWEREGQTPVTAQVPVTPAESEQPAAEPAVDQVKPSFDIVRVEPSGETVIAGRAAPGAEVTVLDGDQALGTVQADESGEFVFLPEEPLAPGAHELGLSAQQPATQESENISLEPAQTETTVAIETPAAQVEPEPEPEAQVAVAQPEPEAQVAVAEPEPEPEAQVAVAQPEPVQKAEPASQTVAEPEPQAAPEPVVVQSEDVVVVVVPEQPQTAEITVAGDSGEAQAAPEPEPEPEQPIAMLTPRAGEGASRVLQQPGESGLADRDLVLNTVDYDQSGRVIISGQAPQGAIIIVYLNNQLIGRVVASAEGRWQLIPTTKVRAGLHTLRVDRVDDSGAVLARVETPFSRATLLTALEGEDFVVVQPGNSLWRIARRSYGQGVRYTVLFDANQGQIRNPDLIYPGQIFVVPPVN